MLSKFFIERPRFAIVIAILTVLAGSLALNSLPITQYPELAPSTVQVSALYPGADAETLQKTVIEPLESQINGVKGMMYISSTSSDSGQATINVTFPAGMEGDINTVNVQNRVKLAEPKLPKEVQAQGVSVKERSTNMLLMIDLYSPGGSHDPISLGNYLSINIKDELARIPGVGETAVMGASNYAMRIWLDADRMAKLGISPSDVESAIKAQNSQAPAGALGEEPSAEGQAFRYTIQTQGRLDSAEEFGEIAIRSLPDGANVRIKDIARVELGAESYSQTSFMNSKPSAKLIIYQLPEGNGLQIAKACKDRMEELKRRFPSDMEYSILYDTTKFISASLNELVVTLAEALLLVVLVTYLFLQNWRAAFVPTVAIPVSLIGTLGPMLVFGYSINMITLFGLILAIGIVVDDAIVVVENCTRLMDEEGMCPREAAIKTMQEVTGPVIATTLVLLAMFVPVCFLPGITGAIYRQFGMTISISVAISTINALTLSPALCAVMLRKRNPMSFESRLFVFRLFNWAFDWIAIGYSGLVRGLLKVSLIILLAYFALGFFAWKLYEGIPTGFIPAEDQGAFFVNVQLPDAASAERTRGVTAKVRDLLLAMPGVKDVMTINGYSILSGASSSNTAFLVGILDDWSNRKEPSLKADSIIASASASLAAMPEAIAFPFQIPAIPGLGQTGGFSFAIQDADGLNPGRLECKANSFIAELKGQPAIGQAYTTFSSRTPKVFLKFDREKAHKLGVSVTEINETLSRMQGYSYVNDFNLSGRPFKVELQAEAQFRSSIDSFNSLHLRNSSGEMVPISTLVEVESRFGPQYINRYNLYPSVTVNGDAAQGFSSGEAMKAIEDLAAKSFPDMKFEWTDMSAQEKSAGGQTYIVFSLALLFIYLFLVAQYESWLLPMAVMLSVPVAFLGALGATWLMGGDNNIYTQVGFILLFGLACKTAILIVEFASEQRRAGRKPMEAAAFAAKLRFRAVMMTAISFVLGVMPMLFADGAGALSRKSLGAAICGGMAVAAVFGTILIPSFYLVVQWIIDFSTARPAALNSATPETNVH